MAAIRVRLELIVSLSHTGLLGSPTVSYFTRKLLRVTRYHPKFDPLIRLRRRSIGFHLRYEIYCLER